MNYIILLRRKFFNKKILKALESSYYKNILKVHGVLLSAGACDLFIGDKLFTEVKNKPLILYPIETFLNSGVIDTLVIVCSKRNKKKIKQLFINIETIVLLHSLRDF